MLPDPALFQGPNFVDAIAEPVPASGGGGAAPRNDRTSRPTVASHHRGGPHSPRACPAARIRRRIGLPSMSRIPRIATPAARQPRFRERPSTTASRSTSSIAAACSAPDTGPVRPRRDVARVRWRRCVLRQRSAPGGRLPSGVSRRPNKPPAASLAAPNRVPPHRSELSASSRPSSPTGATAAVPYGTCPGGYTVNPRPWTVQRSTAIGKHGPVLRSRQWSMQTQQATPSSASMHTSGSRGRRTPSSPASYGEITNGRLAAGRQTA